MADIDAKAKELAERLRNMGPYPCQAAEQAAALILSQAETIAELKRLNERYASGLRTIASTFYKADQHQDYAKHVLESARASKES